MRPDCGTCMEWKCAKLMRFPGIASSSREKEKKTCAFPPDWHFNDPAAARHCHVQLLVTACLRTSWNISVCQPGRPFRRSYRVSCGRLQCWRIPKLLLLLLYNPAALMHAGNISDGFTAPRPTLRPECWSLPVAVATPALFVYNSLVSFGLVTKALSWVLLTLLTHFTLCWNALSEAMWIKTLSAFIFSSGRAILQGPRTFWNSICLNLSLCSRAAQIYYNLEAQYAWGLRRNVSHRDSFIFLSNLILDSLPNNYEGFVEPKGKAVILGLHTFMLESSENETYLL